MYYAFVRRLSRAGKYPAGLTLLEPVYRNTWVGSWVLRRLSVIASDASNIEAALYNPQGQLCGVQLYATQLPELPSHRHGHVDLPRRRLL